MSGLGARHVWEMPLKSGLGVEYAWLTWKKGERSDMSGLGPNMFGLGAGHIW
jgi:hypothetical protein